MLRIHFSTWAARPPRNFHTATISVEIDRHIKCQTDAMLKRWMWVTGSKDSDTRSTLNKRRTSTVFQNKAPKEHQFPVSGPSRRLLRKGTMTKLHTSGFLAWRFCHKTVRSTEIHCCNLRSRYHCHYWRSPKHPYSMILQVCLGKQMPSEVLEYLLRKSTISILMFRALGWSSNDVKKCWVE